MVVRSLATVATVLALGAGVARAGDCNRVLEAGLKSLGVPSKTTTTTSGYNVMPKTAVVITVDGKRYAQRTNRGWTVSPWNSQAEQSAYRRGFGSTDSGCDLAGSETIDGEAADMFDSHYLNGDGTPVQDRLWISQATGLPLREEARMGSSSGGGFGTGTVTLTTTMDYKDVHAPTDVTIRPGDDTVPDPSAAAATSQH